MKYIIGSRGSRLALIQTKYVQEKLAKAYPEHTFEIQIIKTKGDKIQNKPLDKIGGKGLFVKEIEEKIISGEIHMGVHSMKDMPSTPAKGLVFTKVWKREDPRDVLILRTAKHLSELREGAVIATGSKIVYAADNAKATTNNDSGDTVTSPKKIISVVYDDSGSMAGERWTYANYSLQTLTSLLNTQDELYVTYMSDPSDAKKISLTDIQDSVDKIRDKEDSHNTPEESIDTAVGKLESIKGTDATTQYWLIIMTDGAINEMSNESELQKKIDSVKNKKMDNGSSMYIDYLGMGDAWNIKADEANGLYSFKATDDKILDVMKALANQISGRIEVDSSNITQVDKKTVKVHSELPLYSLSVLSQESDAKVLSAKAENELDVERNISLNATDLKNGIKKEKMF